MINLKTIENLSRQSGNKFFVTSLYLNIDPLNKQNDYKIVTKDLLKEKRSRLEAIRVRKNFSRDQVKSVLEDLTRIEDFVLHDYMRNGEKGLAVFSCNAKRFWQVLPLPKPTADHMVVDFDPYIRPLSELLSEFRDYGVVLVDTTKATAFEVGLDQPKEVFRIQNPVGPRRKEAGFKGREEGHSKRHQQELVMKHFKKVVNRVEKMCLQKNPSWLILGGRHDVLTQFEGLLPTQLKSKVSGHVTVEPNHPLDEVLMKAAEVARAAELSREKELIARLKGEADSNRGGGTAGLQPTLEALRRGLVATLVVTRGYVAPGFFCGSCHFIGAASEQKGETCPICGEEVHEAADVIDEAIAYAYANGCAVEHTVENSVMRMLGDIGALLRSHR